jgi:hypothetical protein
LDAYSGERQTKLALKLITLTFLRTTELRAEKWNELEDLNGTSAHGRGPHDSGRDIGNPSLIAPAIAIRSNFGTGAWAVHYS